MACCRIEKTVVRLVLRSGRTSKTWLATMTYMPVYQQSKEIFTTGNIYSFPTEQDPFNTTQWACTYRVRKLHLPNVIYWNRLHYTSNTAPAHEILETMLELHLEGMYRSHIASIEVMHESNVFNMLERIDIVRPADTTFNHSLPVQPLVDKSSNWFVSSMLIITHWYNRCNELLAKRLVYFAASRG